MIDRLTVVEGEERLKTEIDFLDEQLKNARHEIKRLRQEIKEYEEDMALLLAMAGHSNKESVE